MIDTFEGFARMGLHLHGQVRKDELGAVKLYRDGFDPLPWPKAPDATVQTPGTAAYRQWGNARAVVRPGWTPPPIPPEESAADAAAGREFLGYGIASKASPLAPWIAFGPDGTRWAITTVLDPSTGAAEFGARRYGVLGMTTVQIITTTATMPTATGYTVGELIIGPDGGDAIVPLFQPSEPHDPTTYSQALARFPKLYQRITITINKSPEGDYSLSAAVTSWKTGAELIDAFEAIDQTTGVTYSLINRVIYSHTADGYNYYTLRPTLYDGTTYHPSYSGETRNGIFQQGFKYGFGAWYNAAGEPEVLWCDVLEQETEIHVTTMTGTDGLVRRLTSSTGAYSLVTAGTRSFAQTETRLRKFTITLRAGATALDTIVLEWERGYENTTETSVVGVGTGDELVSATNDWSWIERRNGAVLLSATGQDAPATPTMDEPMGFQGLNSIIWFDDPAIRGLFLHTEGAEAERRICMIRPWQWSNNCIGLFELRYNIEQRVDDDPAGIAWECRNAWARAYRAFGPDYSTDDVLIAEQRIDPPYWVLATSLPYTPGSTNYGAAVVGDQYHGGTVGPHWFRRYRSARPWTHEIVTSAVPLDWA